MGRKTIAQGSLEDAHAAQSKQAPMSPLRKRMVDAMKVRHLSPRTIESYVSGVAGLAEFCGRSPDRIGGQQIQRYLVHLHDERKLAWSSCNVVFSGLRFFYHQVLKRPDLSFSIPPRRTERRLPTVLSRDEVERILKVAPNVKHRALLMTTYGGGLRVSEVVRLQPHHIESDRMMIRVEQGKGRKDRYTLLPNRLLQQLREYWVLYRPTSWLFFGRDRETPMAIGTAQKIYYNARDRAGITHGRGIHTLRHAFATHLLEEGYDIFTIKGMMGHGALSSTARYLHITSGRIGSVRSPLDDPPTP